MTTAHQRGPCTAPLDPNPLILSGVFAAILTNVAGVLLRSFAAAQDIDRLDQDTAGIEGFYSLLQSARELQWRHVSLIHATGSENRAIYPLGVETLWMSSYEEVDEYLSIRDQILELLLETTIYAIDVPQLPLFFEDADGDDLEAIQDSIYASSNAGTFGESSLGLARGFDAATSLFARRLQY